MKKITLFFIAFFALTYVFAHNLNSHVFYSYSKTYGDFNINNIDKVSCKKFTSKQLSGRYYVNIEGNTPLEANNFYYLNFGNGYDYYYLTYSRLGEHDDEDEILEKPYSISKVACKTFNSHVFYSASNTYGDFNQNNIDRVSCKKFTSKQLSRRYYVNIEGSTPLEANNFYYLNFGNGYDYYYLTYSRFGEHNDEDERLSKPYNITKATCKTFNSHVFYSASNLYGDFNKTFVENNSCEKFTSNQLSGRYYVNIESDSPLESNKFYYLNFGNGYDYYYLSYSRFGEHNDEDERLSKPYVIKQVVCTSLKKTTDLIMPKNLNSNIETTLIIYNSVGLKIKEQTIFSKNDEQNLIEALPKGFYILNDNKGRSRKIYKKN